MASGADYSYINYKHMMYMLFVGWHTADVENAGATVVALGSVPVRLSEHISLRDGASNASPTSLTAYIAGRRSVGRFVRRRSPVSVYMYVCVSSPMLSEFSRIAECQNRIYSQADSLAYP